MGPPCEYRLARMIDPGVARRGRLRGRPERLLMIPASLAGLLAVSGCRPTAVTPVSAPPYSPPPPAATVFLPAHGGSGAFVCPASDDEPRIVWFARTNEEKLPTGLGQVDPYVAWSPDDRWIAGSHSPSGSGGAVFIMDVATGEWKDLPTTAHWAFGPRWHPDGTRLVFEEVDGDLSCVRECSLGDGAPVVVASGSLPLYGSPYCGERLLLRRLAKGGPSGWPPRRRFYLHAASGYEEEVLPEHYVYRATASASGQVAAVCWEEAVTRRHSSSTAPPPTVIVPRGLPGREVRELCMGWFHGLAWSPDGSRLVGVEASAWDPYNPLPDLPIVLIDVVTGEVTRAVDEGGQVLVGTQPAWAGGEARIMFLRQEPGVEIWSYDSSTRKAKRVYPFHAART